MNATKTGTQRSSVMKEARQRKGWTQFRLARAVGCSESQVTKIETGRIEAPQWLKEAIASELSIFTWEVGL